MKSLFEPEKIERELRQLERELSLTETRTVLFNLVIFIDREDESAIEENLLTPLLGKRAARIIRITLENEGETSVSVSARCAPDRENRGVCFQEILIENGKDNAGIAPGSWSAFLIRDLPVYVLWRTLLPDGPELGPLGFAREQADKFLLDGRLYAGRKVPLETYVGLVKKHLIETGVQVTDFAWERTRPLRVFTAQAFDQKRLLDLLPHVTHLDLAGPEELPLWYYAAWSRSVLGEEGTKVRVTIQKAGEVRIGYRFRDSGQALALTVDSQGMGRAMFGTEELLVKPLREPSDGAILLEQVDIPISDAVFRRILS